MADREELPADRAHRIKLLLRHASQQRAMMFAELLDELDRWRWAATVGIPLAVILSVAVTLWLTR